jgi:microcystin-dependent protein
MSTPYLGEIRMFGGNFAPRGFANCSGQLLSIAQNSALFALLGTTFGGDGQSTFGLPDLRGRVPVHQGAGTVIGEVSGVESVTLTTAQMPAHTHDLRAAAGGTKASSPTNAFFASGGPQQYISGRTSPLSGALQGGLSAAGGAQPHNNMMPYAVVTFIIALEGIFPSRN